MAINFANLSELVIPEGSVTKITSGGTVLWEKVMGTPIGELPVGTIVKLNVNGASKNFIVVHQGRPSTSYDSSCNGTWLLMEDAYEERAWDSSNNDYANSDIHSYLNNTFVNLFDSDIKSVIKQVKLPYTNGTGKRGSVAIGSSGISAKIFLLSCAEIGYEHSYANVEGSVLDYSLRVSSVVVGWLRSPRNDDTTTAWWHSSNIDICQEVENAGGYRPALILPSDAVYVDTNNNVVV